MFSNILNDMHVPLLSPVTFLTAYKHIMQAGEIHSYLKYHAPCYNMTSMSTDPVRLNLSSRVGDEINSK